MINVMIVEDDPMAQKLLEIFVNGNSGYQVAHVIESAAMAEFYCMTHPIDLILMDVCTAMNVSGLEAAEKIKSRFPHIRIIIITSQPECSFIDRARAAGVESFWYKTASAEEILTVMDRTMAGEHIFPDKTPEVRLGLTTSYELTPSELDVIRALMQSTGDEDAANMLGCTKANIRWHLNKVLEKTGYRTRMELLIAVAQKNLIIVTPDKALDEENF